MVQLIWPTISYNPFQNALDHATSLEANFEALDACVKLSSSKHQRLPSSLKKDIIKAILKAFTDNDFPYEISEADESLIGGILLKHITAEAAERARDRVPLQQYHDLRKCYQEFFTKLNKESSERHPNAIASTDEWGANNFIEPSPELGTTREYDSASLQSRTVRPAAADNGDRDDTRERAGQADLSCDQGRDTTKEAIVINRPEKKGRKRKRDELRQEKGGDKPSASGDHGSALEIIGNQHRVEEVDIHTRGVYSGYSGAETDDRDGYEDLVRMLKDTEAQGEHLCLQLQDFESDQLEEFTTWNAADELMQDQDMVEKYVVEEYEADSDLMEGITLVNDPNDHAQKRDNEANSHIRRDSNEQFQHAREVRHEVARPDASSLITFNIEHQAAVNLLDDMGSVGIIQNLSSSLETMRSSGYDLPNSIHFTNAILLDDGDVEVHAHARSKEDIERLSRIRGWDLEFEKSISVPTKTYAVETPRISVDILNMPTRKHKVTAIRELVEENLGFLLSLRGIDDIRNIRWCKNYKQESSLVIDFRTAQQADEVLDVGVYIRGKHYSCQSVELRLRRCGKCQAFGHYENRCPSAHRCGRCASQHVTSACTSNAIQCANCYVPHQAKSLKCKAREAYKQTLRYTNASSSVAKIEHQNPAPEPQSRTATLNLPSPNLMPIAQYPKGDPRVADHESHQNDGPVQERRAAASRLTLVPANPQREPCVKVEDNEPTQEMGLAQNHPPDLALIQRRLDDLQMVVERLTVPQHSHSRRTKRGANERLMGRPFSHAREQPRQATQRRVNYPVQNHSHADWDVSRYPVRPPGQRIRR